MLLGTNLKSDMQNLKLRLHTHEFSEPQKHVSHLDAPDTTRL